MPGMNHHSASSFQQGMVGSGVGDVGGGGSVVYGNNSGPSIGGGMSRENGDLGVVQPGASSTPLLHQGGNYNHTRTSVFISSSSLARLI